MMAYRSSTALRPLTILIILVPDFERFRTIELPGFFSGFL